MKAVLGFSGGLDTCYCLAYLKEKGYEVVTVTVDTGGFEDDELEEIGAKAKQLGAVEHITVNAQEEMYDNIISYIIKGHAFYEDSYPNLCSDRYIISEKLVEVARKKNAGYVAHGSTGQGNDQVRFDVAMMSIASELMVLAPIREQGITRDLEIKYLEEAGFHVGDKFKKYTVNQNILGITVSGSEIDQLKEPEEMAFVLTKRTKSNDEYVELEFERGLPVGMNSKRVSGVEILKALNKVAGSHGFGRGIYTGDCIIGIKGHILFEAPGLIALMEAHKALEQLTLTKPQLDFKKKASHLLGEMLYEGKYFDPVIADVKAFLDSNQKSVSGTVKLKFTGGCCLAVELSSCNSLIRKNIADYAQRASWSGREAENFIKLYGLQQKIYGMK